MKITMRTLFLVSVCFLVLYFTVSSCTNNKLPEPATNSCDSVQATFTADVNPIIQQNCAIAGCHVAGGSGSGDFTTYQGLKPQVDNGNFRHSVIEGKPPVMPPSGQLPAEQLRILECWLDNGAPNN